MAITHGDIDTVIGVAISGIPFSVLMAEFIEDKTGNKTSLAVYHPNKHKKVDSDSEGTISSNFGSHLKEKKLLLMMLLLVVKL